MCNNTGPLHDLRTLLDRQQRQYTALGFGRSSTYKNRRPVSYRSVGQALPTTILAFTKSATFSSDFRMLGLIWADARTATVLKREARVLDTAEETERRV